MQRPQRRTAAASSNNNSGGLDVSEASPSGSISPMSNNPTTKRQGSAAPLTAIVVVSCLVVIILVAIFTTNRSSSSIPYDVNDARSMRSHALDLGDQLAHAQSHVSTMQQEGRDLKKQLEMLKKENKELKEASSASSNTAPNNEAPDVVELKKNFVLYKEQNESLKKEIQKWSRMRVLEKFGPGPHQIEIKLDFPPKFKDLVGDDDKAKFVLELAPLDLMPHSILMFLEQTTRGLWDGCSFHRNANHVLQAGPAPYYKSPPDIRKKFRENDLMSVSFQEYSPQFPHLPYTMGYAGRPGGPDFYVSILDNTRNHGPGGQASYAIPSEADPCFAKVISGKEVIDKMHKLPIKPGDYNALVENVGIEYAKLLK